MALDDSRHRLLGVHQQLVVKAEDDDVARGDPADGNMGNPAHGNVG